MTNIYLVRHAHSVYTPDEMGRPLSEKGLYDAEKITEILSTQNITQVISSPYRRAIQTVEGIAKINNLEIHLQENFRERKLAENPVENFNEAIQKLWSDLTLSYPGGESGLIAQQRGIHALESLVHQYPNQNIAIGTHGNIMVLMMHYYDPQYNYTFWSNLKMPDIYQLTFEDHHFIKAKSLWQ